MPADQISRTTDLQITASDVYFHGEACCVYENVDRLKVEKENYLQLVGNYFQSYKYFDHLRDDIRAWLLPNITVQDRVRGKFPPRLNDDRYLICIHIRREDFVTSNQKEASNAQFSTRALNYLLKKYDQNGRKIGTIILGNEIAWEKQTFGDTHIVENSTVAEDFALSRMFCDAFLITAPSSSFGWFLGYVSKTMNVYYRDITDTTDLTSIEMRQGDFFPPNWVRLKETNSTVEKIATSPHLN